MIIDYNKIVTWALAILIFVVLHFAIYGISILLNVSHETVASGVFGGYVLSRIYIFIREK